MSDIERIVLSVTGSDRPGLTSALSEAVVAAGGNWKEGHLSRLGGLYVGSVLVELPAAKVADLQSSVQSIDADGLNVVINPAGAEPASCGSRLLFELIGQDRPGIIQQVSKILAGLGANIESLSSGEVSGAWSGEHLFKAQVQVTLPSEISAEDAQRALEDISSEIMVDLTFGTRQS